MHKKLICLLIICCFANAVPSKSMPVSKAAIKTEEIPPTEDLMREHGVLNRLLLIYEEVIRRIDRSQPVPTQELEAALFITQSFIENYHEKLEEEYIFPLFEKHKRELQLIKTLKRQHEQGRTITLNLKAIMQRKQYTAARHKKRIRQLLHAFVRMYRPHEAREDTVLFPQVRSLVTAQEFEKLGDLFEEKEQALFGSEGFENIVRAVAEIEKKLDIYTLEQFTPKDL